MRELSKKEAEMTSGGESLAYEVGHAYGDYVATAESNFLAWAAMTLRSYLQA